MENVIIIGSGPAAHTAAIYSGRSNLNPLVFEGMMAGGVAAGGQLTTTTDVENYPGFPNGIQGPELMANMRQQSINCGARIETVTVDKIDSNSSPFKVHVGSKVFESRVIIIATGATAKRMDIKGDKEFWQKGISACAVCDGALPIFRNKPLIVIGGGDSAAEESTFLTKFASRVHLLVRRDVLRASKAMQERVLNNDKITVHWNTEAVEAVGEKALTGVNVINNQSKEQSYIEASGLFYAIGHLPNTAFLDNQLDLDETGYIITKPGTTKTSKEGIFACGDVQDKTYRQAITAAGSGCMSAIEAEHFISSLS